MNYKNYETVFEKDVKELKSKAILLKHIKTGARVFVLSNDDDNKVFYIGFRTPPENDTGVAHIMEHSVLCGSRKYPLKDPFVELVKGSLNTFLNAMTYPDKTVYPVASRNDKDFKNLMDVYLDAVFYPAIYDHPEIMKQEGWSYKIESEEDAIEYNGVVYNEMKGAFSSPEGVLDRQILHSLYPETSYAVESGGDPANIPELTYEEFLDFHRRYYNPSNSYIYLYGDIDIEERLAFLDEEYLSSFEKRETDSAIKVQSAFSEPVEEIFEYPISEGEDESENTYLTYNLVCGTNMDPKQYFAMSMVLYALVGTQGAPVKDRLLKEGIGKDVLSGYENGILQPYFNITAKNAELKNKDAFLDIIKEEFEKAAREGLNKKSLIASLNSLEFKYKEADYGGYPKGLIYGLSALDGWLYDESRPLMHIECDGTFKELRDAIDTDYYEDLVKKYLTDNPHSSLVALVPAKGLAARRDEEIAKKLAGFKESLSKTELDELIEETAALKAYQEREEDREQIETIPLLSRSDIKKESDKISNEERVIDGIPVICHDHYVGGISYIQLFFDCNDIDTDSLKYLSLLKSVISYVDTENYTYKELNDEININTGGLSFETGVYPRMSDKKDFSVLSDLTIRTLNSNTERSVELLKEVLFSGRYDDMSRLYEIIAELKSRLQMVINTYGNGVAVMRAKSYYSEAAYVSELTNGIEFYKFIDDIEKNFDAKKDEVRAGIEAVLKKIARPEKMTVSFTGDEEGYALFAESFKGFAGSCSGREEKREDIRSSSYELITQDMLMRKNEGFKTSATVQYVARAGRYSDKVREKSGAAAVLKTILSYDYLWFNIRVQGGAYGCMCNFSATGDANFVTYRDPHLKRSNEMFEAVPDYLEGFDADEREMTKYVIGTMSSVDGPLSPYARGARDMMYFITGVTEEDVQQTRNEIIGCSADDIRSMAPHIRKMLDEGNICVVGSEAKIEEDRELFLATADLFE